MRSQHHGPRARCFMPSCMGASEARLHFPVPPDGPPSLPLPRVSASVGDLVVYTSVGGDPCTEGREGGMIPLIRTFTLEQSTCIGGYTE